MSKEGYRWVVRDIDDCFWCNGDSHFVFVEQSKPKHYVYKSLGEGSCDCAEMNDWERESA